MRGSGVRLVFEHVFEKGNVDCVFTSEIDKHTVTTYSANFGDKNIFGDIREISASKTTGYDILLAGFPCQSFSVAGLKKGGAMNEVRHALKSKEF